MLGFPEKGLPDRVIRAFRRIAALNIPMRAAYAGYFMVLSVFPALLLILSSLQLTGLQVADLVEFFSNILPEALMDTARRLIYAIYQPASRLTVSLSVVVALWSASNGIYGLMNGLNAVYGVSENRGWLYTRIISVVYALAFLVVLLLTLVLHVFGGKLVALLRTLNAPVLDFAIDILNLRFFFLLALQSLVFTGMYMLLPNGRQGFFASLPGGMLSTIGWQIFSNLYSIYVTDFSGYASLFGSVYAVALSMLWLYFCLSILLYGGALNHWLMGRKK